MKIKPSQSILLLIDLQESLLPHIKKGEQVAEAATWAMNLAQRLTIPVLVTEHFPEKIGLTVASLRNKFGEDQIIAKTYFSAVPEGDLVKKLQGKQQVIVMGTEAHVCVLQTVLDLLEKNYAVFILESAVGSRKQKDKKSALKRMQQNGAEIITREMLAFEWLEKAGTATFKDILHKFIK